MTEKPEVLTEVTTIAAQNEQGANIAVPDTETIIKNASVTFVKSIKLLNDIFTKLSIRGKSRVLNAILDLPQDNLPVYLKDDLEKKAFVYGQQAINSRFIITYYHTVKEIQAKQQLGEQNDKQDQSEETSTEE